MESRKGTGGAENGIGYRGQIVWNSAFIHARSLGNVPTAYATLPSCGARLDAHKSENRKRNRKGKGKGSPSWNFALKVKERGGHYFFSNNKELTL